MSTAALDAWGWRIPFLLGLVVGIAGYFLRRHVHGNRAGGAAPTRPDRRDAARSLAHRARFRRTSAFNAVGFYVSFVYLVSWLQTADGIAPARALEINSFSMAVLLPVVIGDRAA